MKLFVLCTKSESCDDYTYVIKHPKKPTDKELKLFLKHHACDKDDDEVYEYIESITEVIESEALTIPTKLKKTS